MNWKDGMIIGVWIGAILSLAVTWMAGGLGIGTVAFISLLVLIVALLIEGHGYVIVIERSPRR